MQTKIAEYKGYTVVYEVKDKEFKLLDKEGAEVGKGATQKEVEAQADKLLKQGWNFPIEAVEVQKPYVFLGRVTSVNPGDGSFRFVERDVARRPWGHVHTKQRLGSSGVFVLTAANKEIVDQVFSKRSQIEGLEKEIGELCEKLEKPINFEYFGLERKARW